MRPRAPPSPGSAPFLPTSPTVASPKLAGDSREFSSCAPPPSHDHRAGSSGATTSSAGLRVRVDSLSDAQLLDAILAPPDNATAATLLAEAGRRDFSDVMGDGLLYYAGAAAAEAVAGSAGSDARLLFAVAGRARPALFDPIRTALLSVRLLLQKGPTPAGGRGLAPAGPDSEPAAVQPVEKLRLVLLWTGSPLALAQVPAAVAWTRKLLALLPHGALEVYALHPDWALRLLLAGLPELYGHVRIAKTLPELLAHLMPARVDRPQASESILCAHSGAL